MTQHARALATRQRTRTLARLGTRAAGSAAAAVCLALVLGSCGGESEEDAPTAETETAGTEEAEAPVTEAPEEGDDEEAGETGAASQEQAGTTGPSSVPELAVVEWPDAPRELTEVEQMFFIEPGPYGGDAYDEDAVVEAVRAMNPGTPEEWERAILSQIQGDYVEDAQAAITFDPTIGDTGSGPTEGPGGPDEEAAVGSNHFALLLDASGSMGEQSGTGTRMEEAKEALAGFVATIPPGSTVSLRVYGHGGDNTDAGKTESCASSEVVYEGDSDEDEVATALDDVAPVGWTPLGQAIEDAAEDIPEDATDGIVYVVTDGLETCGGDPVAAAGDLAAAGIQPVVNVIGFQLGDTDQQALRDIAEAGGGEYTPVESGAELEEYWEEEYSRMMQAWDEWKAAELDRIDEEGAGLLEEADEVGGRLLDGVDEQGERALAIIDRLAEEGTIEVATRNPLWSAHYSRKNQMWSWAYGTKTSNWSAAYGEKSRNWSETYRTGTDKWSEYYRRYVDQED